MAFLCTLHADAGDAAGLRAVHRGKHFCRRAHMIVFLTTS